MQLEARVPKRAAVYVRVSTASKTAQGDSNNYVQNPEIQEQPLRELIAQRGWTTHRVYSDRASGAKERRPGLDALMTDARRGQFDAVIVWRFDRFARSVKQLILALEEFQALGIDFISHQEALDTSRQWGRRCSQSSQRWQSWNGASFENASSPAWNTHRGTGRAPACRLDGRK